MNLRKAGEKFPVHVAAGAKAILAFSPPEMVDHLIRGELKRFTPNTITKPNIFKQQLREIREKGIALDHGEYNIEVYAVAAPIFNANKKPIAAILIAVPFFRVEAQIESTAIMQLREAASKISARLLYSEEDEVKEHKEESA
jgi:IclR family acetate operon transcriptional repressor